MSRREERGRDRSSTQRILRAIVAALRVSLRHPVSFFLSAIMERDEPVGRVDGDLCERVLDRFGELLDRRLGILVELGNVRLHADRRAEPAIPHQHHVSRGVRRRAHCMTAELRYLDLSVYVIPAMQIVTSFGSPGTSPPVESALPVSRMFLAYSSAAQEAPSLKPSMPGMVYL